MKKTTVILVMMLLAGSLAAQTFVTKNGYTRFFSTTPVEDIEAINRQVNAAIDTETGEVFFRVLIKSFNFEKALMQEHFNENYMESDKFPNAEFKGSITDLSGIDFTEAGEYKVIVKGTMEIHGVSREMEVPGTITVQDGSIRVNSVFQVKPADHKISIPGAVRSKIAESIEVTVDSTLKPKA